MFADTAISNPMLPLSSELLQEAARVRIPHDSTRIPKLSEWLALLLSIRMGQDFISRSGTAWLS